LSSDPYADGRVDRAEDPPPRISTEVPPGTGRTLAFVAGGLAVCLAIGFGVAFAVRHHREADAQRQADESHDAKDAVDVVAVRTTARHYPLTLPGQTAGWEQSTLYPRVDGYVGKWLANLGDRVKAGQVLATIETPDLDQQLTAARAKAGASAAQVQVAEADAAFAKQTYARWRDSPRGVVSEQEREETKSKADAAAAQLTRARAQAQLDEADVARYSALEGFRQVTAPYDGTITGRTINLGNLVSAGTSGNARPLYTMAQMDPIRVMVDVPQKAAAETEVGLRATVTADAFPGRRFAGTVAFTGRSVDPQTRTEQVEVDVPNPDLTLVPGMYVQVTFELDQHGLLEVPAAAILYRPDGLRVAVVGSGGRVQFRRVTIAQDDGDVVELASGVEAGDKVALNISSAIRPGQEVTAVDAEQDRPPPPATAQAVLGQTVEPAPAPANTAPTNRPAGGVGGD
jgi:RND family efflux transporter MFP subunit